MFKFEEMITPKIIGWLYILTLVVTAFSIFACIVEGQIGGAIGAFIIFVFSRVFFELLILKFKSNEYLRETRDYMKKIVESMEDKPKEDKSFNKSTSDRE